MNYRAVIFLGAILAAMGVASGAIGAHLLEDRVKAGLMKPKQFEQYETAVRYQMYHALGLMLIGLLGQMRPSRWLTASAVVMIVGCLLFSGGLYGHVAAVSMQKPIPLLVKIIPIGGGLQILSWVLLAIGAVRKATGGIEN